MLLGVVAGVAPTILLQLPGLLMTRVIAYQHVAGGTVVPTHVDWGMLWLVCGGIFISQVIGNLAGYGQSYLTAGLRNALRQPFARRREAAAPGGEGRP